MPITWRTEKQVVSHSCSKFYSVITRNKILIYSTSWMSKKITLSKPGLTEKSVTHRKDSIYIKLSEKHLIFSNGKSLSEAKNGGEIDCWKKWGIFWQWWEISISWFGWWLHVYTHLLKLIKLYISRVLLYCT